MDINQRNTLETLEIMLEINEDIRRFISEKIPIRHNSPLNRMIFIPFYISMFGQKQLEPVIIQSALDSPSILNKYENVDDSTIIASEIDILITYPLCKTLITKLTTDNEDGFTSFELIYKICDIMKYISRDDLRFHEDEDTSNEIIIPTEYFGVNPDNLIDEDNPYGIFSSDLDELYLDYLIYDVNQNLVYAHMGPIYNDVPLDFNPNNRELLFGQNIYVANYLQNNSIINKRKNIDKVVIPDKYITIKFSYSLRKVVYIKHKSPTKAGHTLRELIHTICYIYSLIYNNITLLEDIDFMQIANYYVSPDPDNKYGIVIPNIHGLDLYSFYYDPMQKLLTMYMGD